MEFVVRFPADADQIPTFPLILRIGFPWEDVVNCVSSNYFPIPLGDLVYIPISPEYDLTLMLPSFGVIDCRHG